MTEKDPSSAPDAAVAPTPARNASHQRYLNWWATLPDNARGSMWILLAAFQFTIMTAFIKLVGQRIHVTEILLTRQIVMTLVVAPTILRSFPQSLHTPRLELHGLRVVLATTAMLLGFTAIIKLPLADATAISFAKSFFVTVFAIIFLKEVVGLHRWGATIVGFIGVLIMLNPSGDAATSLYGLMAVGGAACAGLVMILIRLMSRTDKPVTILTYQAVGVGLVMALPAAYYWVTPTWEDAGYLLLIGVISWGAQMCNIQAFRVGEATAITSLDYTRLLYATLIGGVFFAQWPGIHTLIGAAIIIVASLYTVHREARRKQALVRAPDGRGYSN
ncbi:DMT family transporter [Breoghania sp. L-A4]|uniref:DMT family transporter n=1 Tax=Breoghania sp. L-A4 TaxID=2304600 RepID=UPI000E35FBB8|nr:DMT family transporter [Breoghania sp. L-A4]AXS41259.1 DMT family transporter [Breoghania sp. L-A4]